MPKCSSDDDTHPTWAARTSRQVALLLVGAWVAMPVFGQAPPAPSRPSGNVGPSKACIAAGRKLQREQQSLDGAKTDLDRYTKSRASCTTKTACARADSQIAGLNKRIPRFEMRLRTFQANRDEACKPR